MVLSRTATTHPIARKGLQLLLLASATFATATLATGCGVSTQPASQAIPASASSTEGVPFGGSVHGGQIPVSGARIDLWVVGKTGYGSNPTHLAYTTTASDGSFAFQAGGNTNYTCPSSSTLPVVYLTATGGDPSGNGSGANSAIKMMAILAGPTSTTTPASGDLCGTILTAKPFVVINEVSTVVAMYGMAQFFNPNLSTFTGNSGSTSVTSTSYTTETFGTSSTNNAGIVNAVNNIGSIMDISGGGVYNTYAPYGAAFGQATLHNVITATPEVQKINLIANILAACINTTSNTSTSCTKLFADAVPPPTPATTALGSSATFPTATDTLQATYYLAVNPINATTPGVANTARMADLFNLASASPPFPSSATQPTDWTIGVTFGTNAQYNGINYVLSAPTNLVVDGQGDIAMISNTSSTVNNIAVLNPFGGLGFSRYESNQPLLGLAFDPGGGTVTNPTYDLYTGHNAGSQPTTLRPSYEIAYNNAFSPGSVAVNFIDSQASTQTPLNGQSFAGDATNIFFPILSNGYVYQVLNQRQASTSYGATGSVAITALNNTHAISGLTTASTIAVDTLSHLWVSAPTGNAIYQIPFTAGTLPTVAAAVSPTAVTGLTSPTGIAIDHGNNVWVVNGTGGTPSTGYVSEILSGTTTAVNDTVAGHGGINNPTALAVDGAGNIWVASAGTTTAFTGQTVSQLANISGTLTALSPSVGFAHTYGGPGSIAIDLSGNVWVANSGTTATSSVPGTVTMILGAAVPVVTTLANAVQKDALGSLP